MITEKDEVIVRQIRREELLEIAKLEKQIWDAEGVEVFTLENVQSWFELYEKGFLVAESMGRIVGYTFAQRIQADPGKLELPPTFMETVDNGFCRKSHKPDGNFHFCVTVCSVQNGAGRRLVCALIEVANETAKPLLGVSRVVGLAEYLRRVRGMNPLISIGARDEMPIAWHYAVKSAIMVGGRVANLELPFDSRVELPEVSVPDQILSGYMKHPFRLIRPLPGYIRDPKSADFGMLCEQIIK